MVEKVQRGEKKWNNTRAPPFPPFLGFYFHFLVKLGEIKVMSLHLQSLFQWKLWVPARVKIVDEKLWGIAILCNYEPLSLSMSFEGLHSFSSMNHFPFLWARFLTFSLFHSQEMLNHGCKRLAQSKPLHWKSLTLAFFWRRGFLELKYTFEGEVLKISKKLYLLSCFVFAFRLI